MNQCEGHTIGNAHENFGLISYFKHRGLLLTDEHTDVWVPQVSAVDLLVSSSRVNVGEGLVDLQGPHTLVVHPVRGDAPLLAE